MNIEPVSIDELSYAGRAVLIEADIGQKSEMFFRIAERQPHLAMVVASLSQDGVDEEMHGHILEIFLVLYLACVRAGDKLPKIEESDLDCAFRRVGDMHKYLAEEPDKKMWDKVVHSHPEQQLLAFVSGRLTEMGILGNTVPECKAILTMQGVLEALTDARKRQHAKGKRKGKEKI